ncbi:MAG: 16S rRNA (cytosine(1402)-N(4))-methyltransferase RsmH [Clostridia bacterium]|nr:16S rRNA (cytosine(1402)-N(4))-methyltransferase RsmH [Clostridia bacterium]
MNEEKTVVPAEGEHKRRKRYSGKYPKRYDEKYKELNPEKYEGIVEHVKSKGNTPAGMHISICVNEILEFFDLQPGMRGLDATLGYGGHTQKMLEKIGPTGHICGLDVDPIESEKTKARLKALGYGEDVLSVILTNFKNIDQVAVEHGKFDFILADLGVSSMQIDNPERGFSYKNDGPLDLRLNPQKGQPAYERLRSMHRDEIEGMLVENSDEPYAEQIAKTIDSFLKAGRPIETTMQLRKVIEKALAFLPAKVQKDEIKKSCARTFQALRIDVNDEFEVLYEFLEKLPSVLKPGGKVAILTFHSGEDRLVKKSFKYLYNEGVYSEYARDVIRPSAQECAQNSRAKSTKMRWAILADDK